MGTDTPCILVLNGPNLNLLGQREPDVYGHTTLDEILKGLENQAQKRGYRIRGVQSNHEGDLVDALQVAQKECVAVLINGGAYTHTSIAIRDALSAFNRPAVEVHLTNVFAREIFRHKSLFVDLCVGLICGFGAESYQLGLTALMNHLDHGRKPA